MPGCPPLARELPECVLPRPGAGQGLGSFLAPEETQTLQLWGWSPGPEPSSTVWDLGPPDPSPLGLNTFSSPPTTYAPCLIRWARPRGELPCSVPSTSLWLRPCWSPHWPRAAQTYGPSYCPGPDLSWVHPFLTLHPPAPSQIPVTSCPPEA